MVTAKSFRKNFPPDIEVPDELMRLLEYQRKCRQHYSGYFELTDGGTDTLVAWFDDDAQAASQFACFGAGPDGSCYCYWLYKDQRTLDRAPVVFLDSEGEENSVLANNTEEFMALLWCGYEEPGRDYYEIEETERLHKFRGWLEAELGVAAPVAGKKIIKEARKRQPDLKKWINDWHKKHRRSR